MHYVMHYVMHCVMHYAMHYVIMLQVCEVPQGEYKLGVSPVFLKHRAAQTLDALQMLDQANEAKVGRRSRSRCSHSRCSHSRRSHSWYSRAADARPGWLLLLPTHYG